MRTSDKRPATFDGKLHAWRADLAACAVAIAFFLLVAIHLHHRGQLVGSADFFPDFGPFNLLVKSVAAWSHIKDGFGGYDFPTYVPLYALGTIVARLFSASVAQTAQIFIVLSAAWCGTYLACRMLRLPLGASAVAATFYAFGPATQSFVTWLTGSFLIATFPWMVLLMASAVRLPTRRRMITFLLALAGLAVFPLIGSTPQLFFEFILGMVAFGLYFLATVSNTKRPDVTRWAILSIALTIFTALWWIIPEVVAIKSQSVTRSLNQADLAWPFRNASLLNVFRFISPWTWIEPSVTPYAARYDANILLYVTGFIGFFGICVSVAISKGTRARLARFLLAIALAGFLVVNGLHDPGRLVNTWLYRIPGFILLAEPAGAGYIALFATSVSIGIAVASSAYLRQNRTLARCVIAVLIFLCAVPATPVVTASIFDGPKNGHSWYTNVPSYWKDAASYLDQAKADGSLLVLPVNQTYQRRYDWGYTGVDLVPAAMISRPTMLLGASLDYLDDARVASIRHELDLLESSGSPRFPEALRAAHIAFVLCRGDAENLSQLPDCGLNNASWRFSLHRFGDLLVADVANPRPFIEQWPSWIAGDYDGMSPGDVLALASATTLAPRIHADRRAYRIGSIAAAMIESTHPSAVDLQHRFVGVALPDQKKSISILRAVTGRAQFDARPRQSIVAIDTFAPGASLSLTALPLPTVDVAVGTSGAMVHAYNPGDGRLNVLLRAPVAGMRTGKMLQLLPGENQIHIAGLRAGQKDEISLNLLSRRPVTFRLAYSTLFLLHAGERVFMPGLDVTGLLDANAVLEASAPAQTPGRVGVLITFERSGTLFTCHSFLHNGQLRIGNALVNCLRSVHASSDLTTASIRRIDFALTTTAPIGIVPSVVRNFNIYDRTALASTGVAIASESNGISQSGTILFPTPTGKDALRKLSDRSVTLSTSAGPITGSIADSNAESIAIAVGNQTINVPYANIYGVEVVTSRERSITFQVSPTVQRAIASFDFALDTPVKMVVRDTTKTFESHLHVGEQQVRFPLGTRTPTRITLQLPTHSRFSRIGKLSIGVLTPATPHFDSGERPLVSQHGERIDWSNPPGKDSLSSLGDSKPSVVVLGAPFTADEPVVPHTLLNLGWVQAARVHSGTALITNGQLFTGTWVAVRVSPNPSLLMHLQANLWENAWASDRAGTIVMVECISLIEFALLLLAIGAIAIALRRALQ